MTDFVRSVGEYLEYLTQFRSKNVRFRGTDRTWKMLPGIVRSYCRRISLNQKSDSGIIFTPNG